MKPIDEVKAKTQETIAHTVELNEAVAHGAVKATEEVGVFYKRIIEGKPTDLYHISNAFIKIAANNIAAAKQCFKSFYV
ncbi:MAG: hypothetical protein QNK15_11640 [Cycloclasticus sp.]|nr:hypothetical protein [Cycloclasticus sp.]